MGKIKENHIEQLKLRNRTITTAKHTISNLKNALDVCNANGGIRDKETMNFCLMILEKQFVNSHEGF